MSILVYDGLRELIKRQIHDRNLATIDNTANSVYSMINEVMSDYRAKAIQIVSTLPVTGVAGTIYVMSKSEPNEKNRFIAYAFENGEYVQVGSSFFPEDFEHDSELSTTSTVTVENRAIKTEIDKKYNTSCVINNVVYNDVHSVHANDTPTSTAIKQELDTKLDWNDATRISDEMLAQLFRPDKVRLVYPYIAMNLPVRDYSMRAKRLEGCDMLTGMKYKSGLENASFGVPNYYTAIFTDTFSNRDIRIKLGFSTDIDHVGYPILKQLYDAEQYPAESNITNYNHSGHSNAIDFRFLDPVSLLILDTLRINFKTTDSERPLIITTYISDTGEDNTYTNIQDNKRYNYRYTDGIPFYGFK